jgi:hypothetical protein
MSVYATCGHRSAEGDHPEETRGGSGNSHPPLLQLLLQRVEINPLGSARLFMTGEITPDRLTAETAAIGEPECRLRSVHLTAHAETPGGSNPSVQPRSSTQAFRSELAGNARCPAATRASDASTLPSLTRSAPGNRGRRSSRRRCRKSPGCDRLPRRHCCRS